MKTVLVFIVLSLPCNMANAQQLNKQMSAEGPTEHQNQINPEPEKSLLIVRSQIPDLRFDSNRDVDRVNKISSGDWEVWLPGGTHILKIDAEGFQRLELPPFSFAKKRTYELVIKAVGFAPTTRADENLAEITFALNEDSVYTSYADFTPVISRGRTVSYKLPKGEYTFRFQKRGFADQQQTVNVSQSQQVNIALAAGISTQTGRVSLPGFIRLTSNPTACEVIINGQKTGTTPYQAELTAGTHQLELRKPLYHPDISTFMLEGGKTQTLARKLKPKFGYLSVSSNVPGSSLALSGKNIGSLPLVRRETESGKYSIRVEAPLYHPYVEDLDLRDGEAKVVTAELKPAFGAIEISSMPEQDAEVFVDGVRVGKTPYNNTKLASGRYILKVSKSLFGDAEEELVVADGQTSRKTVMLSKNFGTLTVDAPNSAILVNGKNVGSNHYSGRLAPGTYSVQAQRTGPFKPALQSVFLAVGEDKVIALEPEGRIGGLTIMVEPVDAGDAEVFVNGELKGNAPLGLKLLIGSYTVNAKKAGYFDAGETVTINQDETKKLVLQLLTYEGSRQAKADKWGTVKWISGIAGVLAGGATVYFKIKGDSDFDRYRAATTSEAAQIYRDKVEKSDNFYKISLIGGGALLTTALVSWIVQRTY